MKNRQSQIDNLWVKCPQGAIQSFADVAKVDRAVTPSVNMQRRSMLTATAAAAGVVVLGGVAAIALREQPMMDKGAGAAGGPLATNNFGGINCIEVVKNVQSYIAGTVGDAGKSKQIEEHLKLCDKCREIHEFYLKS